MKMRDKPLKKHMRPKSLAMIAQSKTHGKGHGLILAMDFSPLVDFFFFFFFKIY